MRAEVTKHVLPGRKSLGRPANFAAVGTIWEASKLGGWNIVECPITTSKPHRGKIVFADETESRPKKGLGKVDDAEEETGKGTRWTVGVEGPASEERSAE